jgi:hypothetical protein
MRKLLLGAASIAALAAAVEAANVTYTLSLNDNGQGVKTMGSLAVYATVSPDNGGLYGFGVDLEGTFPPNLPPPALPTWRNMTPNWNLSDPDGIVTTPLGFNLVRADATIAAQGKFGAGQGLEPGTFIPLRNFGISPGTADSYKPDASWSRAPGAGGGGAATWGNPIASPDGVLPIPQGSALIGTGTWTGPNPTWNTGADTAATVWESVNSLVRIPATVTLLTRNLDAGVVQTFKAEFGATADTPVLGTVNVTGGAGNYESSVLTVTPGAGAGGVNVNTIGEPGVRYVMLELGGTGDINAVLTGLDALAGVDVIDNAAEDPEFADLHGAYDVRFADGAFDALLRLNAAAGNNALNLNLGGVAGVTIDQVAVVPEPATIGLLSVVGVGLLARRRRA